MICALRGGIGCAPTVIPKGEVIAGVRGAVTVFDAPALVVMGGRAASFAMTAPLPMASKSAKILVVDDQPEVGAVLADYFSGRGFEVVRAEGGLEALAKIKSDPPAMVLLDVRMPDLDGVEVLRKIRA